LKDPAANIAALKPQIEAIANMAASPDEQLAAGGMLFNAGITGKDLALQLRGAELIARKWQGKARGLPAASPS
jgi:hypothetical protein